MKIAYCDCFSGISGDMFLAALLDAGMPLEHLQAQLALLKLPEAFEIGLSQTHKGAIVASLLEIKLAAQEHTVQAHTVQAHTHEHEEHAHTHDHTVQEHAEHEHPHDHTVQEHAEHEHNPAEEHSHPHQRP